MVRVDGVNPRAEGCRSSAGCTRPSALYASAFVNAHFHCTPTHCAMPQETDGAWEGCIAKYVLRICCHTVINALTTG